MMLGRCCVFLSRSVCEMEERSVGAFAGGVGTGWLRKLARPAACPGRGGGDGGGGGGGTG